ncbi:MAG: ATP-dependent Clp protease adapter ClpS [Desulfovibrionaceae bacterium]|nr:ATP-dependent Clp protease adapter ClpS [Desulfovibrionaceae bacterium]
MNSEEFSAPDAGILEETRLKEPRRYQVLLHNDDYTTMEFVVTVLMEVFHKDEEQATAIMLSVHKKGIGVAGVYPREVAETKIAQVRERAARAGFPLRCSLREEGA